MAPSLEQLAIDKLSIADRIELVQAILDSVAEQTASVEIPDWHRELLDERIADAKANPNDDMSWEEVKASLKAAK